MSKKSDIKASNRAPHELVIEWLKAENADLEAKRLLISERKVIDRLLDRSLELRGAFTELFDSMEPMQWQAYMGAVLSTAAFWNPAETKKLRDARSRLEKVNTLIIERANELADLIGERTALCEEHAFTADDAYHVCDLIDRSSYHAGHYESYLKPELDKLRSQYDLKYWPRIDDLVREIGDDAANSKVQPIMEITQEAIRSRIASRRDYLRALFAAIEEQKGSSFRNIPIGFNLTDNSLAALVCCALDLAEGKMIDAGYVKRMRQAERKRADVFDKVRTS